MGKPGFHGFRSFSLFRRTRNIAIGAEYAAVSILRLQQGIAPHTAIEMLAGVGGHLHPLAKAALRACERGGGNNLKFIHMLA